MRPKPGEVYRADLGLAGKVRPVLVVSREDAAAPRALTVCVPLTTEKRGSRYEVTLPRVRFLREISTANVQGVAAFKTVELHGPIGRFEAAPLAKVKDALRWLLEL